MATFLEPAPLARVVASGPPEVIVQCLGIVLASDVVIVAQPGIDDVRRKPFAHPHRRRTVASARGLAFRMPHFLPDRVSR